ncbi:hypothetical protein NV379_06405 [Paenibacillus sp. N1-5-1-14]|uniref:hypothetical protein n=1 Tax=Paenibacillus radicibacter TaxID=2972488 RepID=UPI002159A81C|nr:hypothetical protein [Paenibacillus radicibacter]MCR8642288.1 hypothetical protein [Paenibacillus radicibacter]
MDKRKVILAYRRGFITIQECAQIMGIDSMQIMKIMNDPTLAEPLRGSSIEIVHG